MTVGDSGEISGEMPVYLRLRGLLAASILEGAYSEGEQLPSVRAFASAHGANPLTVAKAYQSLQDDGYVAVRRGVGMFVADGAVVRLRDDERDRFMTQSWPRIRAHMHRIGIELRSLTDHESV
jgi:GntR family transcriptional regulator